MTTLAEQITRIRDILQDSATSDGIFVQAHQEALAQLGRLNTFTQITWMQAIEAQAVYALPGPATAVYFVLYNEHTLRYASEASLDRLFHGYEQAPLGDPKYWTTDNQAPNTLRLIPAPSRTGSLIPVIPSPLVQDMRDNIAVFHAEDVAAQVVNPENTLPTLLDWDDMLVYSTAKMLALRETTVQNLPVAQLLAQVEQLWRR